MPSQEEIENIQKQLSDLTQRMIAELEEIKREMTKELEEVQE